jgi:hypothetical protein
MITLERLQLVHDFGATHQQVERTVQNAAAHAASLVRFLGRYASWNGYFGSGVAALAGKIGRSRGLFRDPSEPVVAVADRSVHVASFFFDAARDEFDDRDTVHRDTHRCLAQAMLKGVLGYASRIDDVWRSAAQVNVLLAEPLWLKALQDRVAVGYGAGTPDDLASVFRSMGYHLGSEVLADQEFSLIDRTLKAAAPELVAFLEATRVSIAGQEHLAWSWIRIHSGHGGKAEAEHFAWAVQGVERAFRYVEPAFHADLERQVIGGFRDFARDHGEFFELVLG